MFIPWIKKIKNQPWHIDGEIIDDSNEVEAIINPSSLKLRVPQELWIQFVISQFRKIGTRLMDNGQWSMDNG